MESESSAEAEDDPRQVGQRLRAARAKIGMTRKQLAAASRISERYLAQIESGGGNPSVGVLAALATALDVAAAELLPLGGERSSEYELAASQVRRLPEQRLAALSAWVSRQSDAKAHKLRRIVLIGLRGAGKSTLGQALAKRLRLPFFDLSKEVERTYGAHIGLLLELGGQNALRRHEEEAWEALCEANESAVIAAPGGIAANPKLYDRVLATAHSIWLKASPEDHMSRVMAQGDFRPMASNRGAMADLKAILRARAADYARTDASLDTSAQPFDTTVDLLEANTRELIARH